MSERKTDDATLIEALRILSRTIKDGDGVIPACLAEAAARLETLVEERRWVPVGVSLSDEEKATLEWCRDKYVAQEIDFLKRNDPQHRWLAMWQQSFECLNSIIMKAGGKAKEQERRWIPVGERLPDEKVDVLARGVRRGDYGYTADETVVTLAWRSKDGWSEVRSPQHSGGFRCTEWMPLPEKEEVGRE